MEEARAIDGKVKCNKNVHAKIMLKGPPLRTKQLEQCSSSQDFNNCFSMLLKDSPLKTRPPQQHSLQALALLQLRPCLAGGVCAPDLHPQAAAHLHTKTKKHTYEPAQMYL